MSQELIYTSAPQGLKPGSKGFCTVASTHGMTPPVAERLESLSGYRHVYPPHDPRSAQNPVNHSHLKVKVGGQSFHVLSRICDAGLDYSQRSNKLAHHVSLLDNELVPAGPAWMLASPGFMETNFNGEPRLLPAGRRPPVGNSSPAVCRAWQQATGDAGWGGVLAETALVVPPKQVNIIYPAGMDVLPLVVEALALLPPERRWGVTFSTYFTKLPPGIDCQWRFLFEGEAEATAARRSPHQMLIDLCSPLGAVPDSPFVEAARSGKVPDQIGVVPRRAAASPAAREARMNEYADVEPLALEPELAPHRVGAPTAEPPLRLGPPPRRGGGALDFPVGSPLDYEAAPRRSLWKPLGIAASFLITMACSGFIGYRLYPHFNSEGQKAGNEVLASAQSQRVERTPNAAEAPYLPAAQHAMGPAPNTPVESGSAANTSAHSPPDGVPSQDINADSRAKSDSSKQPDKDGSKNDEHPPVGKAALPMVAPAEAKVTVGHEAARRRRNPLEAFKKLDYWEIVSEGSNPVPLELIAGDEVSISLAPQRGTKKTELEAAPKEKQNFNGTPIEWRVRKNDANPAAKIEVATLRADGSKLTIEWKDKGNKEVKPLVHALSRSELEVAVNEWTPVKRQLFRPLTSDKVKLEFSNASAVARFSPDEYAGVSQRPRFDVSVKSGGNKKLTEAMNPIANLALYEFAPKGFFPITLPVGGADPVSVEITLELKQVAGVPQIEIRGTVPFRRPDGTLVPQEITRKAAVGWRETAERELNQHRNKPPFPDKDKNELNAPQKEALNRYEAKTLELSKRLEQTRCVEAITNDKHAYLEFEIKIVPQEGN
jgi:hypothetical protein